MADNVIEVTQDSFDAVKKDNSNLIVDCWAAWCGPCRMMGPVIDKLADDYKGKVSFGKLNVDQNQKAAQQFKVMAIPTLLFFKNGELVDQSVGLVPREDIEAKMKKHF
ncbi:thioredoxin [Methanomassiliicoccus luminyensis]|jgi:thioredoxin 1|uniref:thioredoxin n=1 Tax=Methanomassiliicoccus luminyensis TaxID=1080712 RepID=UPI0003704FD0|nr:thioredoxin [Methanomassiliicoccus luminyensis]